MNPALVLKQRGIEQAAKAAGWKTGTNPYDKKTPGWRYPVYWPNGDLCPDVTRWKAADSSADPKYVWYPKGVKDRPQYYMLPGLVGAIQAANGELHMVSGEPDMLTMVTVGIANVTCAFGEKNITTLVEDLRTLRVERLIYWRDRDETGLEAAKKARDSLLESGIDFECRLLPGQYDQKYDLNRLWIDVKFDVTVFFAVLNNSLVEVLPPTELVPTQSTPPPSRPLSEDWGQLYEDWCSEVEQTAIRTWNIQGKDGSGFSKMIPCPFHQETQASAHWNYQTHGLRCFGACGRAYNTQECAERLGFESWVDYKKRHAPVRTPAHRDNGQRAVKLSKGKTRIVSGREAAKRAKRILSGEEIPNVEPFLAPYVPFRQFGGRARLWTPRQTMLIISGSGMGKTSIIERSTDNLCVGGGDSIIWGPEWTPETYQYRRVSRWGGPSVESQEEHAAYQIEKARGVLQPTTKPLSDSDLYRTKQLLDKFIKWPGDVHYLDRSRPFPRILADAAERIAELREDGRRVMLAVFDYAQKALSSGQNWAELELIFNEVSQFAVNNDVFAILLSQVNKGEAEGLKKHGNLFDMESAQLLSDQKANCVITLNPVYIKEKDENDRDTWTRLEKAWINVVKNSLGVFPAKILVKTALWRHDWTDTVLEGIDGSRPNLHHDEPPPEHSSEPNDSDPWWDREPPPLDLAGY